MPPSEEFRRWWGGPVPTESEYANAALDGWQAAARKCSFIAEEEGCTCIELGKAATGNERDEDEEHKTGCPKSLAQRFRALVAEGN